MKLTAQNLQAIPEIYDVVLDSDRWGNVLEVLAQQVGSIGSNVIVEDHSVAELTMVRVSSNLMVAAEHFVKNGYIMEMETILPNIRKIIPLQKFMSSHDVYLEHNRRYGTNIDTSKYEKWIVDNFGVSQRFTSPLSHNRAYIDLASFQFGDLPRGSKLQRSLLIAKSYLPHLAKVVEITRPFSLLKARFNAVLSVLDRFHLGVAIFSSNGCIVLSNLAAKKILDRNDGLKLGKSNLIATLDSATDSNLREAFFTTNQILDNPHNAHAEHVNVPRRTGATPYIVDVSPLRNREIDFGAFFRGVLVIIVDPDDHAVIDVSGMELLFSLTKAETEVCRLLVSGYTTSEMSDIRGTKPDSIRKQINTLLQKTNTQRRSELVHLALSINLPVDRPERLVGRP
jgi:DNA-binding CsgD family transcriptional regulator